MSRTDKDVIPFEMYETPKDHIAALMANIEFRDTDMFLEPCKANGNIYNAVPLLDDQKDWAEIQLGRDYLEHDFGRKFDIIITNPPFSLTPQFLRKSFSELKPDGTLIYLQRLNYLGSRARVPLWRDIGTPDHLPILVPRPSFTGSGTDATEYCWYIWDRGGRWKGEQGIGHICTDDAELKIVRDVQRAEQKARTAVALELKKRQSE